MHGGSGGCITLRRMARGASTSRPDGRSSIKVVLPTLVPELSYEGMEIADGLTAAIRFGDMYEGRVAGSADEGRTSLSRGPRLAFRLLLTTSRA